MENDRNDRNNGPRGGRGRGGRGRGAPRGAGRPAPRNPAPRAGPAKLDYLHNAANYSPVIRKGDLTLAAKFESYGLKPLEAKNQDTNTHPVAAGLRSVATARALGLFYKMDIRHVYSMFGSPRDDAINLVLNKCTRNAVGDAPCDMGYFPRDPAMLALDIVRPMIVPRDITRANANVPSLVDLPPGDLSRKGFLLVDLYFMTPDYIAGLLGRGVGNWAVWIGHRFDGVAGVAEEGGWIRLDDGRILYRSDPQSAPYPPHPDLSWMWRDSAQQFGPVHLVWSETDVIGSFRMVVFKLEPNLVHAPPPPPVAPAVKEITLNMIHTPVPERGNLTRSQYWWQYVKAEGWNLFVDHVPFAWLTGPETKVIVQIDMFEKLRGLMACRTRSTMALKQLAAKAREIFEADRKWGNMYKLFPDQFSGLVAKTTLAVFYHELAHEASYMEGLENANRKALMTYNTLLNSIEKDVAPKPPASGLTMIRSGLGIMAGCMVLGILCRYLGGRSHSALGELILGWWKRTLPRPREHRSFDQLSGVVLEKITNTPAGRFWWAVGLMAKGFLRRQAQIASVIPMNMATRVVVVAPLLEELFKRLPIPGWKWISPVICGFMDARLHNEFSLGWFAVATFLHGLWARLPLWQAVGGHAMFNFGSVWTAALATVVMADDRGSPVPTASGLAEAFFRNAFHVPWEAKEAVTTTLRAVAAFPPALARQPRMQTACCEPKPKDETAVVRGEWPPVVEELPRSYVWWLLPTSVLGFAPARTDAQLMTVVEERILLKPPISPLDQELAWANVEKWELEHNLYPHRRQTFPIVRCEALVNEWFEHFEDARHKKRYSDALLMLEKEGLGLVERVVDRSEIMVKTDELLVKWNFVGDVAVPVLKPRAIAQVHPYVQAFVGPTVYAATKTLKYELSWDSLASTILIKDKWVSIYLFFAPGATDEVLSRWLDRMINRCGGSDFIAIAACGDDSVWVVQRDGLVTWGEGDFGMFDQSQGDGPLRLQDRWNGCLGMDQDVRLALWRSHRGKFVIISRDRTHRRIISVRSMRRTGGADTTQGNTVITLSAYRYCLVWLFQNDRPLTDLPEIMKTLGFDLKLRVYASWEPLTFLKGMWVAVRHPFRVSVYWTPLPSRILKVGKSLRDPRELYREPFELAARHFLSDLANSYKEFLVVGPLATFCARFGTSMPRVQKLEAYKPQAERVDKPTLVDVSNIIEHYESDEKEWKEVSAMIPSVPFRLLCHPLFWRMARIDYG